MGKLNISKFNKIFPWYNGLSSDLLFWVAIDTLFLTVVKKFKCSSNSIINNIINDNMYNIAGSTIKNNKKNWKYKFSKIRNTIFTNI